MFHFGTSGNSDGTGDVHPPTVGRGCGDFSNTTYPATTRYPTNPHPEHGEDFQLSINYAAAECQQVHAHGKNLLSLGLVKEFGIQLLSSWESKCRNCLKLIAVAMRWGSTVP